MNKRLLLDDEMHSISRLRSESNERHKVMNQVINFFIGVWLTLVSYSAIAAEAESIRHEIEVFLSSGLGSIVSIILLLLFLLWLLLPLAVFGLKGKLNQLTRETRETNKALAEIRETGKAFADSNESNELLAHIDETNKILADIREELSVLNEEEVPLADTEQSRKTVVVEDTADLYDEIKYEP